MTTSVRTKGRIKIEFDDQDAATPVMVYVGRHSATYWCATETGSIGDNDEITLTAAEQAWLESNLDHALAVENKARS